MMTLKMMAAVAAMMIASTSVNAKQSTATAMASIPAVTTTNSNMSKKVTYTHDRAGRITSKTVYCWNATDDCWTPSCQYNVTYGRTRNTLTYSRWCQEDECFKPLTRQVVSQAVGIEE